MTVPTSDNREQYPGNDSATEFDYTFKIFKADDLVVTLTDSDDNESTLTRGTDYSVDGVGNENGGSVTYPLSGDPLATGETLTILREIPVVQETDLRNQGRYYPETLEDEFDRSRMIDQQQQEQLGRTLSRTRASDYFDAKGRRIANVGNAVEDQDAYTKGQADARFANDVITQTGGEWDAKSDPLGNLGNPQDPDHATTKAYVDGRFDTDVITKTGTHWDAELQQIRNLQTRQPPSSTDAMNFGATSLHVSNVLNSADPQTDGWQRVRWVNTIADLQALDTSELVDGQAADVKGSRLSWNSSVSSWQPIGKINVKAFGAIGDGIVDDTNAIQAALQYAYDAAEQAGWRGDTATVYLPRGIYRVAQPNILFSGLLAGSFRIVGDGGNRRNSATHILYDVPSVVSTEYMIDNDQIFGFSVFSDITFEAANGGNFMHLVGGGSGNAQSFTFERCAWSGWTDHINVIGSTMGSEVTFWRCKLEQFDGVSFRMNNSQAVNWRFYATEIESFAGTVFEFIKGMTVLFSQGSIIPVGSDARVLKVPSEADSNAFGGSNRPHVIFHGTRFEMHQGALMTEKVQENCNFMVKFDGCGMGGNNIPIDPIPKMFTWAGRGQIAIRDCGNCKNYLFDHTVNGSSSQDLNVIIDNSDFLPSVITDSIFAITGATSNDGRKPLFNVTNCGEGLDGSYRPTSDNQYDVTQQKHNITFSRNGTKILVEPMPEGGWPATRSLSLPPVRLTNIQFYPISNTAYGTSATATITIKSGDGTQTLASFTWNMADPVDVVMEAAANYRVQSESGEDLLFEFSSSYTGTASVVFSGLLYLTY